MSAQQQRYRVIERIAAGGMAEVFRAESAGLEGFKKKVAIKRVLPHLAGKKEFMGMFLDEARLSAHLGHSNCVQVFDIGQGDDTYFIVMEMVDGADLKGVIQYMRQIGRLFPTEEACLICVKICEGLTYAHELCDDKGVPLHIVHRDMSPPNVLMTRHGEVKIADFGLAKANSQLEESQPGIIKGKFGYLSPEAAQGKAVDHRTAIFAVGIILWEMLAGRRLFQGETDLDTVRQVQRAAIPDIRKYNPQVPDSVLYVLNKALAGNPDERYQTARDLGHDLNAVLFSLSRAVSSFDLANLVLPVEQARLAEKAQKARSGSLIGSLIDQALFQFTSLDAGGQSVVQGSMSGPFDVHSFSGTLPVSGPDELLDWGNSLGFSAPPEPGTDQLHEYQAGNLSALEDTRSSSQPSIPSDHLPAENIPPHGKVPSLRHLARSASGTGVTGKIVMMAALVVLFAAGGLVGAYFMGSLPAPIVKTLGLPKR